MGCLVNSELESMLKEAALTNIRHFSGESQNNRSTCWCLIPWPP